MIKALSWAMRQHPDKLSSLEKLVLIGLADMCNDDLLVIANYHKLSRFACIDQTQAREIVLILNNKGFIKTLDDNQEIEQLQSYKLIVTQ